MDDDLWLRLVETTLKSREVANVSNDRIDACIGFRQFKQVWLCRWRE
jgi:hypothetical protein